MPGNIRNDYYIERLAAIIKRRRLELKLTQTQLAIKLDITYQQIQKYENATNAINSTMVPYLCAALEITPNELYEWES